MAIAAGILYVGFLFVYVKKRQSKWNVVYLGLYTAIGLNFFLNLSFYPALLEFQAGSNAGNWIATHKIPVNKISAYQYETWRSLNFYANGIVCHKDSVNKFQSGEFVLTNKNKVTDFDSLHKPYQILYTGNDFKITRLSLNFLNPKTREKQLSKFVLLKIK